jgi:hypothetical protein
VGLSLYDITRNKLDVVGASGSLHDIRESKLVHCV